MKIKKTLYEIGSLVMIMIGYFVFIVFFFERKRKLKNTNDHINTTQNKPNENIQRSLRTGEIKERKTS